MTRVLAVVWLCSSLACSAPPVSDSHHIGLDLIDTTCESEVPIDEYALTWLTAHGDRWELAHGDRAVVFDAARADQYGLVYREGWRRMGYRVDWTLALDRSPEFAGALTLNVAHHRECFVTWEVRPPRDDATFEFEWQRFLSGAGVELERPTIVSLPTRTRRKTRYPPLVTTVTAAQVRMARIEARELERRRDIAHTMEWLLAQP